MFHPFDDGRVRNIQTEACMAIEVRATKDKITIPKYAKVL
jgi:hypothetical protein